MKQLLSQGLRLDKHYLKLTHGRSPSPLQQTATFKRRGAELHQWELTDSPQICAKVGDRDRVLNKTTLKENFNHCAKTEHRDENSSGGHRFHSPSPLECPKQTVYHYPDENEASTQDDALQLHPRSLSQQRNTTFMAHQQRTTATVGNQQYQTRPYKPTQGTEIPQTLDVKQGIDNRT
jgi:hypothetical protein